MARKWLEQEYPLTDTDQYFQNIYISSTISRNINLQQAEVLFRSMEWPNTAEDEKRGGNMAGLELAEVILAVIIGTLAAIVYSLRVLILMEKRVASMEENIQKMTRHLVQDDAVIKRAVTKKSRR